MKSWWFLIIVLLKIFGGNFAIARKIKVINGHDPGRCTEHNNVEVVLIQGRQEKYKFLICAKHNGIFQWRSVDGSSSPGEFVSPSHDCSRILDANPKAKDGFYWVTIGGRTPIKVWCDMTTDGGGFMLIGRKNSSVTWTVPSNNKPVEPFGEPHWTTSLSNALMIDFRVQLATAEDFNSTKAHWYYRFRKPRKLKNLMIINKGGCDESSPGIGDVQYVKDLMTGDIVTTKFRCSKFGAAHDAATKLGWVMMNHCLQKPCPRGFAFHHKYPVQTDFSGVFSYSTVNSISGINFGATALIGCDNSKCCGCFGPKHGRKNYCFHKCNSQNGGTIRKNVYSWFWVRSSIPKSSRKLWNKCMEYSVLEKGIEVWYKLGGDDDLPIKGRCGINKALFYEGTLVALDNETAKEIPNVEGMIVYRKDKNKLYVKGNNNLNALAEEKKVVDMVDRDIARLESKIDRLSLTSKTQLRSHKIRSDQSLEKLNATVLRNEIALQKLTSFMKEIDSKFPKLGSFQRPGKSCASIKKRYGKTSLKDGQYWIAFGNSKPYKVFCDMNSDGGGWTQVSNIVLQSSNGFDWSVTKDFKKIADYNGNKLVLSPQALNVLRQNMPFNQLRFFCRKRIPGRTFDIATRTNTMGENVLKYFTARSNILPKSCGSYYRLPDDNSIMAQNCAKWGYDAGKYRRGKWHVAGYPVDDRLSNHAAFIGFQSHWLVSYSARGRWECDDYRWINGYRRSVGDFWKIFVR